MLALSPLFSTTYGWPSDDLTLKNALLDCNDISREVEANSYNSFFDGHAYDDILHEFAPENSTSSGGLVDGDLGNPMLVEKKLSHNASERHRRKRVNDLYAFLRSLLPMSSDQKRYLIRHLMYFSFATEKVSIPGTVSRALKYIPELQKEVETLMRKRKKLSAYSSSKSDLRQEHAVMKNKSGKEARIEAKSSVVSSVIVLGEKEAVIQLIPSTDHMSESKQTGFMSRVLEYLEQEEDTFVFLNATTFKCSGERMSLSTLHLQVQGDNSIDAERLKEKLCNFDQQSDQCLL